MSKTNPLLLAGLAGVLAVCAYLVFGRIFGVFTFRWTDLLFPWVMTALCAFGVRWVRKVIEENRVGQDAGSQVSPLTLARILTAGTASAWLGAVLAGAYAGAALWLLPRWGTLAAVETEGPIVVVGVVSGVVLSVVGMWLEHSCQLPPEKDGQGIPGVSPSAR